MNKILLWAICLLMSFARCNTALTAQSNAYNIIPYPAQVDTLAGIFPITAKTVIVVPPSADGFALCVQYINQSLAHHSIPPLAVTHNYKIAGSMIVFGIDSTVTHDEGYELHITPLKIEIRSRTPAGAFYAVQTLRQLIAAAAKKDGAHAFSIDVPCCKINDAPRFAYRGMHLDVARHMFTIEEIKKYIDLMALYKFNNFHWHLTDDQGWRAEIKKYPNLTAEGAWRKETTTFIARGKDAITIREAYGGFYTQEQMRDVVAYAAARHVNVIPEIEMPGHSLAAIAAYPYLGGKNSKVEVGTRWGVFETVFEPSDTTFAFLEDVLSEIMQIFPSHYIHIGGDECMKVQWKQSAFCLDLMEKEGLKDEFELQSYFIHRIEKYLNAHGRSIIGWDEILEGGLSPNATVMSWRGSSGGIDAARQNHTVIMTPGSHCYFDHYQYVRASEPYAIGGYTPVEKVYSFEPVPSELNATEAKYIMGAQANLWTEYIDNAAYLEYMAYPRACALAEVLWSPKSAHSYDNFLARLSSNLTLLDTLGVNYAKHVMGVYGNMTRNNEGKLFYELNSKNKHAKIKYALNDSALTLMKQYTAPLRIDKSVKIASAMFDGNKRVSDVYEQNITYHIGAGAKVMAMTPWHENYNPGSSAAIVNAIEGSNNYGDGQWFGYWGTNCEVLIDLLATEDIHSIRTNYVVKNDSWIYAPSQIQFFAGIDTSAMDLVFDVAPSGTKVVNTVVSSPMQKKARYIKMVMKNFGTIPSGNSGAGNKAWMFVDEIIVQ